jgi:uncharacterized phiE125 gp8 family phage protein
MAVKKIGVATEVITLDQARQHLRIEPFGSPLEHPDDDYVTALISVARDWCEQYLTRAIGTQEYQVTETNFDNPIELVSPIQSVSEVSYIDESDNSQVMNSSDYSIDTFAEPAKLIVTGDKPKTSTKLPNPVIVTFTAGYTDNQSPNNNPCPFSIRAAMLLIIGNLYENRQQDQLGNTRISFNSLPMGVPQLLQPYRLKMGL